MKKPTVFEIAIEFVKFNFSIAPYLGDYIKYLYLMGTISRIMLYSVAVFDLIKDRYFIGIILLMEALFLSYINASNFFCTYMRERLDELEIEFFNILENKSDTKENNDERK